MVKRARRGQNLRRMPPPLAILILSLFIIAGITSILTVSLRQPLTGQAIGPVILSIVSPAEVTVGESVPIAVQISGVENLATFGITLKYGTDILDYQSAGLGEFILGDSVMWNFIPPPGADDGMIEEAAAFRSTFASGRSGSGVILRYSFIAVAPGTTSLVIDPAVLTNNFLQSIPFTVFGADIRVVEPLHCIDFDGDGFGENCAPGDDCDDGSTQVHPGATEICGNGVDEDCNNFDTLCPPPAPVVCGNGIREGTEVCDTDVRACSVGGVPGTQTCNTQCTGFLPCIVPHPSAPPTIILITPANNSNTSNSTVVVTYSETGDMSDVTHVHLILDSTEVQDLDNDGRYAFSNTAPGSHTLTAFMARTDHAQVGSRTGIRFTLSASPVNVSNQTNRTNSTGPRVAADIGLAISALRLTATPALNLSYNLTNTSNLTSCALMLDGSFAGSDVLFSRRFPVTINSAGRHLWRVSCQTSAGFTIDSPSATLYYFKMSEFKGTTTDVRTIATPASVPNFQLEHIGKGKVQFTQSVDLSTAADLDVAVDFTDTSLTLSTSRAPGLNRPARITFTNIRFRQPRILRDGQFCGTACSILSYTQPFLTFSVPGFSTYAVEESVQSTAPASSSPPSSSPSSSLSSAPADTTVLPCTHTIASDAQVPVQKDTVLCIAGAQSIRLRAEGIGTQVKLIQEAPTVTQYALATGESQKINLPDGTIAATITVTGISANAAILRVTFAKSTASDPSESLTIVDVSESTTAPSSLIPKPEAKPTLQKPTPRAPVPESPAPRPSLLSASLLSWIALFAALAIVGILIAHRMLSHRTPPPTTGKSPELNAKLQFELQALGIDPEKAKRKVEEKMQKKS